MAIVTLLAFVAFISVADGLDSSARNCSQISPESGLSHSSSLLQSKQVPSRPADLLLELDESTDKSVIPAETYPDKMMWNLANTIRDPAWEILNKSGSCGIVLPSQITTFPDTLGKSSFSQLNVSISRFAFGECVKVWKPLWSKRLDLELQVHLHGTDSPGYNPSIIPLPALIKETFPTGQWLAAMRVGCELCPKNYVHSASACNMQTYIAILDEDFATIAAVVLQLDSSLLVSDYHMMNDPRLFVRQNGDILIGFMPYSVHPSPNPGEWMGKLHLSIDAIAYAPGLNDIPTPLFSSGSLVALVERYEIRNISECPELGFNAPGRKKNLGFFEYEKEVYLVDWIYPSAIGKLDTEQLVPHKLGEEDFSVLCFGLEPSPPPLKNNPWEGFTSQDIYGHIKEGGVHNGGSLVWIEEAQLYLGIGHVTRGIAHHAIENFRHHYSHQFYAISGTPPFRLTAASSEFCFSSSSNPADCETLQFASTLLRKGSHILIGYGVMDCESYLDAFDLSDVLASLKNLE